jgi:hypothetical protein
MVFFHLDEPQNNEWQVFDFSEARRTSNDASHAVGVGCGASLRLYPQSPCETQWLGVLKGGGAFNWGAHAVRWQQMVWFWRFDYFLIDAYNYIKRKLFKVLSIKTEDRHYSLIEKVA